MANLFLISDTHFGHAKFLTFVKDDGSLIREFSSVEEMDETMVANWNKVVNKNDQVYHLGDVSIARKDLKILERLNGKKVLIRGNHDIFKITDYLPYFKDIRGSHKLDKTFILSHYPLHTSTIPDGILNFHGHIHYRKVMLDDRNIDPKFYNLCVEHHNYSPIPFEIAKKNALEQV
jgi:calcineurin-like phosphoesterase family protein